MSSDKESKTEKPTGKRLAEARKEGRIAKSAELVSWVSIFASLAIVKSTFVKGSLFLQQNLKDMGEQIAKPDAHTALQFMVDSIAKAMLIVAPLALLFMVIGVAGHLAQVRFVLAVKAIKPNFKKLNVFKGIKQLMSPQSLVNAGKEIMKLTVLGFVAYKTLWGTMANLSANGPYPIGELMHLCGGAVIDFIRQAAMAGIVIGLLDYAYQRKKIGDGLKMTKQEVKEESKSQDAPAEVRAAQRRRQREMSRNRMMAAIKEADVVIVNPVHIAVALKYNPVLGAPKVVAKGAGFVAEKIREKADEAKIPLVQDVPLARTLHRMCDIDDEIPADVFEAVARLLAFVFALRNRGTSSGFHRMPGSMSMEEADAAEERERAAEARKAAADEAAGLLTGV